MPGWHAATEEFQRDGRLQLVGIIQEQHPERARLFMQWKQMDWPVLVDSLDLLDVSVVPITLLIDERGIVRQRVRGRQDPREVVEAFLKDREAPGKPNNVKLATPNLKTMRQALDENSAIDWREYAEALTLWGGTRETLDEAIAAFEHVLEIDPEDSQAAFRLGVARRMRYDSKHGEPLDFTRAVEAWTRARELDPNNYIWMRRLQQYGPRLGKPYPFYDWVDQARGDILDRGAIPRPLTVAPRGAELALPAKTFEPAGVEAPPARAQRVRRDPGKYVRAQALTVPLEVAPGGSTRVHVEFRPNAAADAHWNNEGDRMVLWIDPPEGWQVDRTRIVFEYPDEPTSDEPRYFEFEVESPEPARSTELSAFALYHVCEGINGQCLYRRQDLTVPLTVTKPGE